MSSLRKIICIAWGVCCVSSIADAQSVYNFLQNGSPSALENEAQFDAQQSEGFFLPSSFGQSSQYSSNPYPANSNIPPMGNSYPPYSVDHSNQQVPTPYEPAFVPETQSHLPVGSGVAPPATGTPLPQSYPPMETAQQQYPNTNQAPNNQVLNNQVLNNQPVRAPVQQAMNNYQPHYEDLGPDFAPPSYVPPPIPSLPASQIQNAPDGFQQPPVALPFDSVDEETLPNPAAESIPLDDLEDTSDEKLLEESSTEELELVETIPPWCTPHAWLGPVWSGSFELGINGTEGNSQSFSMRTGAKLERKTDKHIFKFDVTYANTESNSIATQENALSNMRYERIFGDSPWSLFATNSLEYDAFKPFDLRVVANLGIAYQFIKTEKSKLKGRLGSGFSHEIGGPDDSYVPEANMGFDFEHQISQKQKFCITSDYFPEWGHFTNFRLVTDASWEVLLDEATNLSLKVGVIDRYDSTPNGSKHNDVDYSILFLWKL